MKVMYETENNKLEFTYQQKIAMMRILLDIVNADGIVDTRETYFFDKLMVDFSMSAEDRTIVNEKNSLLALVQIKDMSVEQKEFFAKLMTDMVIVDGDVNVNEVAIYDVVAAFCNFRASFADQALPSGLSYS